MTPLHRADRSRRGRRAPAALVVALALTGVSLAPRPTRAAPPCRVSVTGGFSFGTYDIFATAPLTTSVTVTLQCPASPAPTVTISKGNSSTYRPRTMHSGTQTLAYNVCLDPACTKVWGDGTEATVTWAPPKGNASAVAYGSIPAGQDAAAGSYSDALLITIYP